LPNGDLEVRDLESTNGTYLNGERVDVARVAPGDKLQVGRVEMLAVREVD
jgi:pSer/pThr/pTyr-binding forkhead associated (FHA) protein